MATKKSSSRRRYSKGASKSVKSAMHRRKKGTLKRGKSGHGGTVKSRKQAIAIALNEAGASKYKSKRKNRSSRARTERKEAQGRTAQQEREGKSRIGAAGKRESTRAEGGKNARHRTAAGKRAAASRVRGGSTKAQLYKRAQKQDIPNRSKMTKTQLENALKR